MSSLQRRKAVEYRSLLQRKVFKLKIKVRPTKRNRYGYEEYMSGKEDMASLPKEWTPGSRRKPDHTPTRPKRRETRTARKARMRRWGKI